MAEYESFLKGCFLIFNVLSVSDVKPGRYKHYKGNEYEVVGIAKHSETLEDFVIYQQLYGDRSFWIRPKSMFLETVNANGKEQPRFQWIKG
jgi:hypothetical protein